MATEWFVVLLHVMIGIEMAICQEHQSWVLVSDRGLDFSLYLFLLK